MTIATVVLGLLLQIGRPPQVVRSPLESRARDFVENFTKTRFDMASKDFNAAMRELVTPSILAEVKKQSDNELGTFRSIVSVRQRKDQSFRVVDVVCKFDKSLGVFRFAFDALDSIGAVHLDPLAKEPVDPVLEAAALELWKNFVAKDFVATGARFDRTMQIEFPTSRLAQLEAQVAKAYGRFRSVKDIQQYSEDPYRSIELIAAYDRQLVSIRIAFNSDNRVAGIKLQAVPPALP